MPALSSLREERHEPLLPKRSRFTKGSRWPLSASSCLFPMMTQPNRRLLSAWEGKGKKCAASKRSHTRGRKIFLGARLSLSERESSRQEMSRPRLWMCVRRKSLDDGGGDQSATFHFFFFFLLFFASFVPGPAIFFIRDRRAHSTWTPDTHLRLLCHAVFHRPQLRTDPTTEKGETD